MPGRSTATWTPGRRAVAVPARTPDAPSVPSLERLFAYDAWPTAGSLKSVREAGAPVPAVRLMAHIAAAEQLWKGRLHADPTPVVVWPEASVDEIAAELDRLGGTWPALVASLDAAALVRSVSYVNSK